MDEESSRYDTVTLDGEKVFEHRKRLRLTQQRLAEAIGRSRGWISVIEGKAQVSVSRTTAQKLSEVLRVSVEDLLPAVSPHQQERRDDAESAAEGDFTFDSPLPAAPSRSDETTELEAILLELKRLERRIERLLAARG